MERFVSTSGYSWENQISGHTEVTAKYMLTDEDHLEEEKNSSQQKSYEHLRKGEEDKKEAPW